MFFKILKWLLVTFTLLCIPVIFIGYTFYNSGETYGQQLQSANSSTERITKFGDVIGFVDTNGSHTWLGIPYARPPLGESRWRAPEPPQPWANPLQALQASEFCKQLGSPGESRPPKEWGKPIGAEDCLYLNIFAPSFAPNEIPRADKRLPVMVYIHGGGNMAGYANQFKYSGTELAHNHNVIVVNFNYRLGPFGWFSHPDLNNGDSASNRSGNYGNLDTVRALQWVQNNIGGFGGNPDNVTLFGESAGGMNTYVLLASPLAKGLFHKAIVQSGISTRTTPMSSAQNYLSDAQPGNSGSGREIVNKLLLRDNIVSDSAQATMHQNAMSPKKLNSYLRSKSADDILLAYDTNGPLGFSNVPQLLADGTVIPFKALMEVFSNADHYNAVPIILGSNRDEFKMVAMTDETLVMRKYGVLPRIKNTQHHAAYTGYLNDMIKARGVDEIAIVLSKAQGNSVYAYRFDWDELPDIAGTNMSQLIGAAHASEIPFVFQMFDDNFMNNLIFNEDNIPGRDSLSNSMASYWVEFAYSSVPGKGRDGTEPEWTPWNNDSDSSDKYIIFDDRRDGGIRMSSDAITMEVLHQRLLTDNRFPNNGLHSQMYDCLLKGTTLWSQEEFESLGGSTCENNMFGAF
ncbi:MAG: carboxylesterase family protein [Halioglobus sp.]|nr:carboxylesterase family protein [Halioglobus sp.]